MKVSVTFVREIPVEHLQTGKVEFSTLEFECQRDDPPFQAPVLVQIGLEQDRARATDSSKKILELILKDGQSVGSSYWFENEKLIRL